MDNEIKGTGNCINYKYRIHDPRLGRFLSIDPLVAKYPWNSPYAFSENRVIDAVELEGLENIQINNSSRTLNDIMKIYATDLGKTYIKTINDISLKYTHGSINIKRITFAFNSTYSHHSKTIKYGTSLAWIPAIVDGASFSSTTIVGHEIKHAFDDIQGHFPPPGSSISESTEKFVELKAVKFGNYLRSVYGSNRLRQEYLGVFYGLNTDNTNNLVEKVTNFKRLEGWAYSTNDLGDVLWHNVEEGKYYSASYEKSYGNNRSKKKWIVGWINKDGYANFKSFDNEDNYNTFMKNENE